MVSPTRQRVAPVNPPITLGLESVPSVESVDDDVDSLTNATRVVDTPVTGKPKRCGCLESVVCGVRSGWGWNHSPRESASYYIKETTIGLIISFAQVPESVAFAFMAKVEPAVALHAAWIVGVISSCFGGRSGMISGATGAMAAVVGSFVVCIDTTADPCTFETNGIEKLFFAVMIAGLLMFFFALLRLSTLVQLIPTSVMIGFCNGLAIVIAFAQLHSFKHSGEWVTGWVLFWTTTLCLVAMLAMEFWPRVPKVGQYIPSSLVAIVIAVAIEFGIIRAAFDHHTYTIRDVSPFSKDRRWPIPFVADGRYDVSSLVFDDIPVILNMGFKLFCVATLEELMTLEVINELQGNRGSGDHMMFACGLSNVVAGIFGTMGGNAMIGLSVMNHRSGGRGKESGVVAALAVFAITAGLSQVLNYIPIAALTGVMFIVVIHTFKWFSVPMIIVSFLPEKLRACHKSLNRKIKRWDAVVILLVTVLTPLFDLFVAVLAGVCLSALVFAWESTRKFQTDTAENGGVKFYEIEGPLFYGSKQRFESVFTHDSDPDHVVLILKGSSSIFDYSALESLNTVRKKYSHRNKVMEIKGLSNECIRMAVKANHLLQHVDVDLLEVTVPDVPPLYDIDDNEAQTQPTHTV
eukprot:GHVN01066337.1.p1 GENE.GHVN01066337.1~~GHVN01066337.1.p1  ORF type:complete len:634 (+),score=59.17 GHVN01066337.1:3438-5339(+)